MTQIDSRRSPTMGPRRNRTNHRGTPQEVQPVHTTRPERQTVLMAASCSWTIRARGTGSGCPRWLKLPQDFPILCRSISRRTAGGRRMRGTATWKKNTSAPSMKSADVRPNCPTTRWEIPANGARRSSLSASCFARLGLNKTTANYPIFFPRSWS